jgi:hypothetical protein
MGCASIHLQGSRAGKNMALQLSRSKKGWHTQWFYLKNDAIAPLSKFTSCLVEEAP